MRFSLKLSHAAYRPDCGTLAQFSAGQRLLEGPEAEVNPRAEGKRSGSAEIRPHTPIVTYATLVFPLARGIFNFFYETMKDL